jgi:hypothetical protein
MSAALVQDIISSSLRLINVLGAGETMSASEGQDALFVFQTMVDSWQAERLMIFTTQRLVFPLTLGKQVYTYGVGGDFNSPRPAKIEEVSIIWLGNPNQPLELPLNYLTTEQWQAVPVKNIQSSLPMYVWDDGAFPFRNLSFWPIPNAAVNFAVYAWQALAAPATLTTQMAFPPGYMQAFRYNLAVMLAAEFPAVPQEILIPVAAIAASSKAVVKSMNITMEDLRVDSALTQFGLGLYDYRSDMPVGGRGR